MTVNNQFISAVKVNLGRNSYSIYIGENILGEIGLHLRGLGTGRKVMVVTNPVVKALYGQVVTESLKKCGFEVFVGEVPDGEEYKSLDSARMLYDVAFTGGLDRKCAILALGGGVIGDLAGFVAATYMRGIPFIQVPTTLLAQVDSSVGGKVAVNHPRGKNIIGAFYQPKMVYADINTLRTLAEREFRAGMAEVIKYGIIRDREFFGFLRENHCAVKELRTPETVRVVETSCLIKAWAVEQDETEQGLRAILNYGHTFGHAYESLTGYRKYVHGEAVAIGMVTAADTAVRLGMMSAGDREAVRDVLHLYGLPVAVEDLNPEDIIASMYHDKKVNDGRVTYVLPEEIGRVRIVSGISDEIIRQVLTGQV